jgi:amidohydrolase
MIDSQRLLKMAEKHSKQLSEWRRHFHRYPELSFQEKETAAFVANQLNKLPGMKVKTGVGYPTAVIGELSTGSGPVIAVRADMDALPIQEENSARYCSTTEGVMHACGHDAHTAILLGVATLLSDIFTERMLNGTVRFLFQPAEERVDEHGYSGAAYMVKAGALSEVDAVLALHMSPEDDVGEAKVYDGYAMASVDVFKGKIEGTGGHGAYPHLGTDPIWIGNQVMQTIYGITSRRISPLDPGVISIGKVEAGEASNIIPSQLKIEGTVRSFSPHVREKLLNDIDQAFSIAKNVHADYQLQLIQEDPPLYNDENMNKFIRNSIKQLDPSFKIKNLPFGLAGEDFAHMTNEVPGAMVFLGCNNSSAKTGHLHTATFDIDEKVLPLGVAILTNTVKNLLKQ